ncbi:MAG: hypothetical protein JOZ63_13410 [Planctomycetaceae bacterium]|nr:hypothetical protein [Planctomycetaceae bacterium]
MKPRDVLSWKFLFYEAFLPALRRPGPARRDAPLGGLGRRAAALWPPRRREPSAVRLWMIWDSSGMGSA